MKSRYETQPRDANLNGISVQSGTFTSRALRHLWQYADSPVFGIPALWLAPENPDNTKTDCTPASFQSLEFGFKYTESRTTRRNETLRTLFFLFSSLSLERRAASASKEFPFKEEGEVFSFSSSLQDKPTIQAVLCQTNKRRRDLDYLARSFFFPKRSSLWVL